MDDPRSLLMLQALEILVERHKVTILPRVVHALPGWAHPEAQLESAWALADTALTAAHYGLSWPTAMQPPSRDRSLCLASQLVSVEDFRQFAMQAGASCQALWSGREGEGVSSDSGERLLDDNLARVEGLGFYDSASVYFEGEWYAGVDRLEYLHQRLGGDAAELLIAEMSPQPRRLGGELEFFFSFRSPYSYLAMERVARLAESWGCRIRLSPVLPMVSRGLPVPAAKRKYILLDAAREARKLGVAFGTVCDPLGAAVERSLALTYAASMHGDGMELPRALANAIFAQGKDLSRDRVLRAVLSGTSMSWQRARAAMASSDWRDWVSDNHQRLTAMGLWGVPCLRYGSQVAWGQDRLWVIENALAASRAGIVVE